jgi:hypothetical protein
MQASVGSVLWLSYAVLTASQKHIHQRFACVQPLMEGNTLASICPECSTCVVALLIEVLDPLLAWQTSYPGLSCRGNPPHLLGCSCLMVFTCVVCVRYIHLLRLSPHLEWYGTPVRFPSLHLYTMSPPPVVVLSCSQRPASRPGGA